MNSQRFSLGLILVIALALIFLPSVTLAQGGICSHASPPRCQGKPVGHEFWQGNKLKRCVEDPGQGGPNPHCHVSPVKAEPTPVPPTTTPEPTPTPESPGSDDSTPPDTPIVTATPMAQIFEVEELPMTGF